MELSAKTTGCPEGETSADDCFEVKLLQMRNNSFQI